MDREAAKRPMRRTALVAKELGRYNVDIAALSETRFEGEGQLKEVGSGYTFFWSGRTKEERRESGVGFAIKNNIVSKLSSLPKGVNDRLISLRIPLSKDRHAVLVSAYAPTMTNPEDIKEKFYEDLDTLLKSIPSQDKLFVLGDFNARVGTDFQTWEGIIGMNGVGKCNSNGLLLLKTCAEHSLLITNTVYRLPHRNRTSWMHPRSKHWHLIDYVITRRRDRRDVLVTKSMCGADCYTDHKLLVSKLSLQLMPKRRPQGQKVAKKMDIAKLKEASTKDKFVKDLKNGLKDIKTSPTDPEENWKNLKNLIQTTAKDTLGPKKRRHQDWFDDNDPEIQALLDKKHKLHKDYLNEKSQRNKDHYNTARQSLETKLDLMRNNWLSNKADEIQLASDQNNSKQFYDALKAIYGPQSSGSSSPLLTIDGSKLLTEKQEIRDRWAEHSDSVLNRPSSIKDSAIEQLPQVVVNKSLDTLPSTSEVRIAIKALSCGKAPGSDAIPAEIFKDGGPALIKNLTELFISIWHAEGVPQDFKDASIVYIYKRKGDRNCCDNYRGISLLSIAGKILARLLLNRLLAHLEQDLLPESQCGFREGRGTADMIFASRQLQEKFQEQNRELFSTYVDLTKAFDTVSRDGLWKIMAKFGIPDKFIAIIRSFHEGMQASVSVEGEASNSFQVSNGVKQGCVLAPTLFSIMFSGMLKIAFQDNTDAIAIDWRTDGGGLFTLARLRAETRVHHDFVRDFLFADDCALNADSKEAMQRSMDKLSKACDAFGLTISIKKTEVLHQPAPTQDRDKQNEAQGPPSITVKEQELQTVKKFTYLGSTLSSDAQLDVEITNRIAKASTSFGRLRSTVWDRKGLNLKTKLKVYKAVVLTSLLYACETWTTYTRHEKVLNRFHINCLKKLLHVTWEDKIPDTEILERTGLQCIQTLLRKNRIRWAGHVTRMTDDRIPKQLLYCQLREGKRSVGRQKKRFKDSLKESLKDFSIDPSSWEVKAQNRPTWRRLTNQGAKRYEKERAEEAKRKRTQRKSRDITSEAADCPFICPQCNRTFRARIGLISHKRTHSATT
tara:strand:+ start:278 stop:3463 length:3186 start_codon:yes stop_codon:yes gene_type:complete